MRKVRPRRDMFVEATERINELAGPGLAAPGESMGEVVLILDTENYAQEHERILVLRPLGAGRYELMFHDGAGYDGTIGILQT